MKEYSFLKKIEINVSDLKTGMYVAKLDKDWKDSPFLFQGFPIESKEQLTLLRSECRKVTIEFKSQEEYDNHLLNSGESEEDIEKELTNQAKLAEELPLALETYKAASKSFKIFLRQVMQGNDIEIEQIQENVTLLIQSLERHPYALNLLLSVKNKIHYTSEHSMRVSVLSLAFGKHLGMSSEQLQILGVAAMLHDIGKAKIPEKVLNKNGKLDKEEAALIREHPRESFRILSNIPGLSQMVKDVALSHHEREDGNGYPRHIPKDRVSRFAKLVSIIDAYDAIISDRPYSSGRSPTYAFRVLYEGKGKKFDAQLVERFMTWMGRAPIGSLVELMSGEVGFVIHHKLIKNHPVAKVLVVTDEKKQTGFEKVLDLSKMIMHFSGEQYKITEVLADHSLGLRFEHYLNHKEFLPQKWAKPAMDKNSPFSDYL